MASSIESSIHLVTNQREPLIVAHRGGKKDAPENTVESFQTALANGADMIELDVQVTRDGVPILYHPRKLEDATNGVGEVSQHTLSELQSLTLKQPSSQGSELHLVTLAYALASIPNDIPVIVDLKSMPADPLIASLLVYIPEDQWSRLIFYSTNAEHTKLLHEKRLDAVVFEDRDVTRERLVREALNDDCALPGMADWVGFEMDRSVQVTESFALGSGNTDVTFRAWTDETMSCTRQQVPDAKIVFFGVNSAEEYCRAATLGADAIYTDQPSLFKDKLQCNSSATILYLNDFNQTPIGLYTPKQLSQEWNNPAWNSGVKNERVHVVSNPDEPSDHVLAVDYPVAVYGPQNGGAQWPLKLNSSHDELYVSYRVRFPDGFDFVQGGKLPGLTGGAGNTGGGRPSGQDGWSARIMWKEDGNIVQYVYYPDQSGFYGENMPWQRRFTPGKWQQVETRIVMNRPGQRDGIIQSWLDGELVLDRRNIRFRDTDEFAIDKLYFSTFFGGNDESWSPSKDETVLFDDFVVSTQPISHQ